MSLLPYLQCVLMSLIIYFKMSHVGKFTEPTFATDLKKVALVTMLLGTCFMVAHH